MKQPIVDSVAFLQAHFARLFMERHNLEVGIFLNLNAKHGILEYLEEGYEPFHLTGDEGVLEELDFLVFKKISL